MTGSARWRGQRRRLREFGAAGLRRRFRRRPGLLRTAQARRQFLRQFAERPAFDRAQSRRHFGFGRRRWAKRHDIGGRRSDTECGPFRPGDAASAAAAASGLSGAAAGVAGAVGVASSCWGADSGAGMKPIGCSRRAARQLVDAVDVAADAETAIAAEAAVAVEHRQARHFDRQPLAGIVHRPGNDDAAPGFAARHRARDLIVGIELQLGGNFAPRPAECRVVCGPASSMNSSEPTPKRPSASMCQTKRNGCRRSASGLMRGSRRRLCSRHGGCDRRRGNDCLEQRRRGWRSHRVVCRVLRPLRRRFARAGLRSAAAAT